MIGIGTYADTNVAINIPSVMNPTPLPTPVYNRQDDLHDYVKAMSSCEVTCRCIFDHGSPDMFHGAGKSMSNILPGVCKDHVTSIFGLDETIDDIKYIDPNNCRKKIIYMPRVWARTLDKDYYAFNKHDWILPQFTALELLTIFSENIDSDILANLHLSYSLKNFIRKIQSVTIPEIDICKPVGTFGTHCNKKQFLNVCALYALLTSRYLDVPDDLGSHYDVLAAQVLGDAAALQILMNHRIIRKCIDDMLNSRENIQIVAKSKTKIVLYNFLARCDIKFPNTKAMYKPNSEYKNNMITAMENVCDREILRMVLPPDTPKEIINMLKKRTVYYKDENDDQKDDVIRPPLSENKRVPSHNGTGRKNFNNVAEVFQSCNVSIGIY